MTSPRHASRWFPLAVVLSLALLAQSACTYHRFAPFKGTPSETRSAVSFLTKAGHRYFVDRATVRSDTLYYWIDNTSGSFPVEDIRAIEVKRIHVGQTVITVLGVSFLTLLVIGLLFPPKIKLNWPSDWG